MPFGLGENIDGQNQILFARVVKIECHFIDGGEIAEDAHPHGLLARPRALSAQGTAEERGFRHSLRPMFPASEGVARKGLAELLLRHFNFSFDVRQDFDSACLQTAAGLVAFGTRRISDPCPIVMECFVGVAIRQPLPFMTNIGTCK